MSVTDEQKERLRRAKLVALARDGLGLRGEPVDGGPITGLVADGTAVVLAERGDPAALSGALIWARRQGASRLALLVDEDAPVAARLARYFAFGDGSPQVYAVDGASLEVASPEPLPSVAAPPDGADHLIRELEAAGVDVVVEHGVVRGEVLGLEVARLVRWPVEVGGDGELHLEVGVGRFDRDATAAARPDESPAEALRRAVGIVRERRYDGAAMHPIQALARPRWLRATVVAEPSLVDAAKLRPAELTIEQAGLKDVHPAAAIGSDREGRPVVVVCSVGVDLGFVPLAADTRALHAEGARLVLAAPERDHHPATRALIELLRDPAELVAVRPGWS